MEATPNSIPRIRAIANVVSVGSAGYRKLVTTGGVASGWAAEDGARAETAKPTFAEIAPPMGDLFANPAASQSMLDDAGFDVASWLASELAVNFPRADITAFDHRLGTNHPQGFFPHATTHERDDHPAQRP